MFSLLRTIAIVGAIFYFSPVRQGSEGAGPVAVAPSGGAGGRAISEGPLAGPGSTARLDTLWQALPEGAKKAVIEKILAAPEGAPPRAGTDTLLPSDRNLTPPSRFR